ncbi:intermembrane lipid transfer protein VPS13C-like isoform X2 [Paramacrobiotus metropolitanus]|uniref:intermembrane lipid transfer protein VPS13C-like isoform X2 n=1 Tax=Paramacrobiotus metropolitanus TaxID=2943436 RepID=UPI0024458539|nr:intermembrane lipid transfer protein VPS13C-like isoform X2 [Paramacrobiotus metropolitanus]
MVLEGLLAELLNRYIGDYVENLDPKQLNLGIWGGDVKLHNLQIKPGALDDLDLPFKITHGRLRSLVLKIPWKNLYKQPVVVTVSGLHLVAIPNIGLKYNKEKEEKEAVEAKQRELRRLEDAKKLHKNAGETPAQQDSFVEKMATVVIKNLQVDISDIHIRFEDKVSSPSTPFAAGITLKKLSFLTTNENWLDEAVADASKFVYKIINLEALSVYWSPEMRESLNDMDDANREAAFTANIAGKDNRPNLAYVLEPIHLTCNLRLNPKPEHDGTNYQIPKIDLKLMLESLALTLTRKQYEGIVLFADALDTVTLKSKYRKYDPPEHPIVYKRNAREWWNYAQRCVLEADVKPRLEGWVWAHIKNHRDKLRKYRRLYTQKLITAKPAAALLSDIEAMERDLTIFNIVLMRQQAELDAKKLKPAQQEQNTGWWGWMTGKGKQPQLSDTELEKKLADIMTPEEKKKLYEAIDYKEGAPIMMYPASFVENRFDVKLATLAVSIVEDSKGPAKDSLLVLALNNVASRIEQRPSAGGLKVKAVIQDLAALGVPRDGTRPEIMVPAGRDEGGKEHLLDVLFETKPEDSQREYRVKLAAAPVRVIYDAETINHVANFFKPPKSLQLKQLQVAAAAKFQELRESSTAGLRFALETHKEIDVDIHLNASYLIVPETGVYSENGCKLIVDFGDMHMRNIDVPDRVLKRGEEDLMKLEESLYDKYSLALQNIQIIFAQGAENWQAARRADRQTPMHLLQPLSCGLELHQCILQNDPNRPMLRVIGELPSIAVSLTDERLLQLCRLGLSIPLPESAPVEQETVTNKEVFKKELQREARSMARSNKDLQAAQKLFDDDSPDEGIASASDEDEESQEVFFDAVDSETPRKRRRSTKTSTRFKAVDANFTSTQIRFELNEISLSIHRGKSEVPMLKCVLSTIITEVFVRTFDMELGLALANVSVDYCRQSTGEIIKMLRRHQGDDENAKGVLLRLDYRSAKSNAPNFEETYGKTLTRLGADFVGLDVIMDREGLIEIKQFANEMQEELAALMPAKEGPVVSAVDQPDQKEDHTIMISTKTSDIIMMDIHARLHTLSVTLLTGRRELAYCALEEISAHVLQDKEKMTVDAQLKRIKIDYPLPGGMYPHVVHTLSDEVLSVHYVGYSNPAIKTDVNSHDMAVNLSLGAIQIIFLNKFVAEILDFLSSFQTAQARLVEVTSAATQSAVQSVQTAYTDAIRIKMDIKIKAPIIVMPQHSRSGNAILVDLGTLLLSNSFQLTPEKAIMDHMKIDFSAVKLSRLVFGEQQRVVKEISLLSQPQPMELSIVRNLSGLWFSGAPDITVTGGLKSLELRLSKFDYAVLMAILAENFAEAGSPTPPPPPPIRAGMLAPGAESSIPPPKSPQVKREPASTGQSASQPKLTKIKVAFSIGNISAMLYLKELPDVKEERVTEALCGAAISEMRAFVEMFSDNSMTVTATLGNIVLDDLRQADGFLRERKDQLHRRMLERKPDTEGNMLSVVIQQRPNGDKDLDVVVAAIQANLVMSFYLGMLEFIASSGPEEKIIEISETGTSLPTHDHGTPSRPPPSPGKPPTTKTTVKEAPKPAPPQRPLNTMRINVKVDRPEVLLIENPLLADSRVLVLKTDVKFTMLVTPEVSTMDLSCIQLQMFLATFEERSERLKPVLLPVEVGVHASTPFGGRQKLAVTAGYVNLTISPVAVQTIMGVVAGLGQTAGTEVVMQNKQNHEGLWLAKPVERESMWFLSDIENEEEWVDMEVDRAIDGIVEDVFTAGDQLTLNTEAVVIVLETSYGPRTIPMLLLEAKFNCAVEDFTKKMHCTGTLQLEVAYYNDLYDVWEPLLEPVEDSKNYRPWQMQVEVKKNITADENIQALARVAAQPLPMAIPHSDSTMSISSSVASVSDASEALRRTAAMTVSVSSMDPLQLTLSRRTLDVISKMAESFTAAISNQEPIMVYSKTAPYIVINDTGLDVVIGTTGTLVFGEAVRTEMLVRNGDKVEFYLKDAEMQLTASVLKMQESIRLKPPTIRVKIGEKSADILVSRAETRFYFIENVADQSKPVRLVAEIRSDMGHKEVTLRSTVQVENLLPTAVEIFCGTSGKMERLGTVPGGEKCNLPVPAVQNYEVVGLACRPTEYSYLQQSAALGLDKVIDMANKGEEKLMQCNAQKSSAADKIDNFYFNAFSRLVIVRYGNTHTTTPNSRFYQLVLKPIYSVANILPIPLSVHVQNALEPGVTLPPGGSTSICNARVGENQLIFTLDDFAGKTWSGSLPLIALVDEMVLLPMKSGEEIMNFGIRNVKEQGTNFLSVYCPVWIMNKTGLELSYREPLILHRADSGEVPILFTTKTLNSKKRVALKAADSEWSEKFSLDTIGSSGVLSCKRADGSLAYEFGISIKPSSAVLTRLVVIMPYYMFQNNSDVNIAVREENPDAAWIVVPKNSCRPFWPQYLSPLVCLRIEGTQELTSAFRYGVLQSVLLALKNPYGGIYVQTQVSESNVTCSLSLYSPGTAAALLINDTNKTILFKQETYPDYAVLPANCQQLFTWVLPSEAKALVWTEEGGESEANRAVDLNRDDVGVNYAADGSSLVWVSFLDGVQRVLLFTDRKEVAQQCSRSLDNEVSNVELNVALDGIGVSLVDNNAKREIIYLGIVSPGAVWMGRKIGAKKFKPMNLGETKPLEVAYNQWQMLRERDKSRTRSNIITVDDTEITFDAQGPALMTKPKKREIQRTYQPGMWCRVRSSDHHTQFHLKLHKIQLDNPIIAGTRYQVVLYPVPLPATADYKPFTEISVVLRNAEKSAVTQYKLLTLLIQEFELRIDQAFINALVGMFSGESTNAFAERTKMLDSFRKYDLAEIPRSLQETVAKGFGEERQAYYEKLMLQPIKIHLSFSLSGGHVEKRSGLAMPAEFITLFIKSIGVTVTEANDVVLKLGTFERDFRFISQKQLVGEVQSHYIAQVVKQIYMLVFGLDILGNPFGLVRGIGDGVKDLFYEPYLGAVEGPEEFMVGLTSGVRNFVGSTVGSTMGAVGRVTGTLGRAVAALSFDQEFQERRQAELNRSGGDFAGGMASSGRHLVSGVVEGVTGVVRRPWEGAKEEGVEGFVKGLGKGFLGLIARPTTGLIDFASGSLNTIGRAVKGDNTVEWLRNPRFIASDGIVRPYNLHQAEGGLIFKNIKNGDYAKTDEYITHLVTSRERRYILMLTSKRVICLERGDVIHDWNVEWAFTLEQMPEPANLDDKGLCVYVTDSAEGKPLGGLFSKVKKSKRVFIEDRDSGAWFCTKVQRLWKDCHGK